MKMIEIKTKLNEIAQNNYFVEFDGGEEDVLLHLSDYPYFNVSKFTKKEYNKLLKIIDITHKSTKDYQIYFWYDVSGYEYWIDNDDTNYIACSIYIKNQNLKNFDKLYSDIIATIEKLNNKLIKYNIQFFY